ncbi:helix-turn-helix transcriptional regulator [Marinomonas aquiplantarum]|uniref:AraC family transcriptional regulator n=1 Tax=Marinomonas aquiplantarum TaxID=491951 RepID=A0A366CT29_9GAMM|nr:helix-turn-helix transcriptional regulator [Marinomonas aquiplantarum]RBO78516.1 AraC family transcriptional regulator [Marinomonas aquiplantarum]
MFYTGSLHDNDSYDDALIRDYYSGDYRFDSLKSGVAIHGGRNTYRRSVDNTVNVNPHITFVFLLKGELQFSLGKQDYHFSATDQGRCIMISLSDKTLFRRVTFAGQCDEKVVLRGMERWLKDHDAQGTLSVDVYRQAVRDWPLTLAMQTGCEQWLAACDDDNLLHKDMLGLLLLNTTWQHFMGLEQGNTTPLQQSLERLLDQGIFDIQAMAEALHTSVRTLQRRAVEQLGRPLGNWVTEQRLARAKVIMLEQQKSISEAAWLVGYQHASSFIHAFRRAYGMTPKAFLEDYLAQT